MENRSAGTENRGGPTGVELAGAIAGFPFTNNFIRGFRLQICPTLADLIFKVHL
jgi:hypothetical protein